MKKSIVVSLMLRIELVACVKPEKTHPYVSPTFPDIRGEYNAATLAVLEQNFMLKKIFFLSLKFF
jgi:hypothetical protein